MHTSSVDEARSDEMAEKDEEVLRANMISEFNAGRVGFDLFPGGHWGVLGAVALAINSILSVGIVLASLIR